MPSTTCSETLDRVDLEKLVRQLRDLAGRLDKIEEAFTDRMNQAYAQGVLDATKARTGHDHDD
jgi:hypothetical protein